MTPSSSSSSSSSAASAVGFLALPLLALVSTGRSQTTGITPGDFENYLFTQTWSPGYCVGTLTRRATQGGGVCSILAAQRDASSPQASTLTLHGLWPNFSPERRERSGSLYPQYCGKYALCAEDESQPACLVADDVIDVFRARLARGSSGYLADNAWLAHHEWCKHGTCISAAMTPADFLNVSLEWQERLATPQFVQDSIGANVTVRSLQSAFGGASQVGLQCSPSGVFEGAVLCLDRDPGPSALPRTRGPCPKPVLDDVYTNGCAFGFPSTRSIYVPSLDDYLSAIASSRLEDSPASDTLWIVVVSLLGIAAVAVALALRVRTKKAQTLAQERYLSMTEDLNADDDPFDDPWHLDRRQEGTIATPPPARRASSSSTPQEL